MCKVGAKVRNDVPYRVFACHAGGNLGKGEASPIGAHAAEGGRGGPHPKVVYAGDAPFNEPTKLMCAIESMFNWGNTSRQIPTS